jgi:hypothetical protein
MGKWEKGLSKLTHRVSTKRYFVYICQNGEIIRNIRICANLTKFRSAELCCPHKSFFLRIYSSMLLAGFR